MNAQLKELEQLPDVLKVAEFATFMRIDRGLAYEMVRQKIIPAVRLGRAIRIPKLAVQRMIEDAAREGGTL